MDQKFTSHLKARNIRDEIRRLGFEKGVVHCIEMLAEYQGVLRESQVDLAQYMDRLASLQQDMVTVAERMKSAVETIENKDKQVSDDEEQSSSDNRH